MVSVIAKFDGQKIEIPEELRGAAPSDVLIVYPAKNQTETAQAQTTRSFRDFFGKGGTNRTAEEINAQVREERDSWDER
jgi:hypothetical protein